MHVAVVGIDGSGKSSFVQVLAAALQRRGKTVSIKKWFRDPAFREIATQFNATSTMTPEVLAGLHASSTLALLQQSEREQADVFLWDRYIYSAYSSCVARGASRELMRKIVAMFPAPELTIHFLADPRVCFERIEKRGGITFYESGLDRLFRGRCPEAQRRFDAREFPRELVQQVFIDTMTDWNALLGEITDPARTKVLKDFDLRDAEAEAARIVQALFPGPG
jgi:dTMP kinase